MSGLGLPEKAPFRGGSYLQIHRLPHELPVTGTRNDRRLECHHLIPQESLRKAGLDPEFGPAIQMIVKDHMKTETWGRWDRAKSARAQVDEMLTNGDFDGALARDIRDIRGRFGPKYDVAIQEATDWYGEWRSMDRSEVELKPEGDRTNEPGERATAASGPGQTEQMSFDELLDESLQRVESQKEPRPQARSRPGEVAEASASLTGPGRMRAQIEQLQRERNIGMFGVEDPIKAVSAELEGLTGTERQQAQAAALQRLKDRHASQGESPPESSPSRSHGSDRDPGLSD